MNNSNINIVAQLIIQCFNDCNYSDAYIHDKTDRLNDLNEFETLVWASSQLDDDNKKRLAEKIGVSSNDLTITLNTVHTIYNS